MSLLLSSKITINYAGYKLTVAYYKHITSLNSCPESNEKLKEITNENYLEILTELENTLIHCGH